MSFFRPAVALVALAALAFGAPSEARADRMDLIHKRGAIIIGVKGDFPPFGQLDPSGKLVGLEPDLAADFAGRLGVELRLVTVTSANRLQKLEDGSVDMIIATLGDTSDRRKITTIVEPAYYATGATVLLRPEISATEWTELRGKTICATQGALYNKPMAQRYLLDLQIYNGNRDAKLALADGRCIGWLYDATTIANTLQEPDWAGYKMPLSQVLESPWGIAVARAEHGGPLEIAIGDAVADWHRTGLLIKLEKQWGLPATQFLVDMLRVWTEKSGDGSYVCRRAEGTGAWPPACRDKALLTANDVGGLYRVALQIRDRTGLDLSLLYDGYDRSIFFSGLLRTLELILIVVPATLVVGGLFGLLLYRPVLLLTLLVRASMIFVRMTPPLLQIYLVYFCIGGMMAHYGLSIDGLWATALCLAVYNGSALATSFEEAANVVGHDRPFHPRDPEQRRALLRLSYTPLVSIAVNAVKMTGMASAIAVPEMINAATGIGTEHGNSNVMMNLLLVIYFVIVISVVKLFGILDRKLDHVAA